MNIIKAIKDCYKSLSKGQKKVANHVLERPREVALSSAQELGATIGVSETTVIRLCYSLGLSGYAQLQKMIREQLLNVESSLAIYQSSKEELREKPHFYKQVMEKDRIAISETMNRIDEREFEEAVNRLFMAKKVYSLGLRSSFNAASWLAYAAGLVRSDVRLLRPETEDVILTLSEMDEESVLVVISFHRYLKETIRIAELAREKGVYIIAITDSPIAPIGPYSDLLFSIYSPEKSTLDATSALFSFLNALVAGLSVKDIEALKRRQDHYKAIDNGFLYEGREE